MGKESLMTRNTVEFIRKRIGLLNLTTLLSIVVVLFIVVKLVSGVLDYIPPDSLTAFLVMLSFLTAADLLISKHISGKATEAIEKYSLRLSSLLAKSKEVHEIEYVDVLCERIVEIAVEMTGADSGFLLIANAEDTEVVALAGTSGKRTHIRIDADLPKRMLSSDRPLLIHDLAADNRLSPEIADLAGQDMHSLICMPFTAVHNAKGALVVCSRSRSGFAAEEEEMLQYFLDQATLSMQNSRFREDQKNFEFCLTRMLVESVENIAGKKGHMDRVAKHALAMGRELGMNTEELRALHRASILHDIGFLKMDMSKVESAGDCRAHSPLGHDLLTQITFYEDIAPIVLHHHERYDGKGYPQGLSGDDIPLMSRIICVAEAFDAMTNRESYKAIADVRGDEVLPDIVGARFAVMELKAHAGSQFDPGLVELFTNVVGEETMDDMLLTEAIAVHEV